ncbi:hypothetical protein BA190_01990 [Labrys sp. WJW]|uniref:NAD(P)-dependent oxidoreductase n=1 Tax=Labrys sp. WJW TaxID=1737983 RepID=UPI0008353CC7|nr:NAD(P)-dependent oxidoreductase [Labrys sp. WJW]OCC07014.1 hypothetical protein BA190_01990 [Labrys sp. WJW]
MAGHLIKGGHELHPGAGRMVPQHLVEPGAAAYATGYELAGKAGIVFIVAPGRIAGKIAVDMNSISSLATSEDGRLVTEALVPACVRKDTQQLRAKIDDDAYRSGQFPLRSDCSNSPACLQSFPSFRLFPPIGLSRQ